MKKNKKITLIALLISLCALASAFALAACNGGKQPEEPHVHQYSEEWTSDETYHWHKAICEHTDLRTAPEMHIDDDFDDICDVCHSPIAHEHRFDQTKWEANENGHYHPSLCGHPDSVTLVPHAFGGVEFVETCEKDYNLQICTECQYQKIEIIKDYGENPNHSAHMSSEIAEKKATCMEEGDIAHYECNTCGKYFVMENGNYKEITEEQLHEGLPVDKENGHAYDLTHGEITKAATCTTEGTEEFPCLNGCGTPKVQTVPKTPHSWNADGKCTVCEIERTYEIIALDEYDYQIDEEASKTVKPGDEHARLIMGEYPQTLIHDDGTGLIGELNQKAGSSPEDPNSQWTQRADNEHIWTCDLTASNGLKYRGVYYDDQTLQQNVQDTPFHNNNIYWFRYEPIRWRFLKQDQTVPMGDPPYSNETVYVYGDGEPTDETNAALTYNHPEFRRYIDNLTNDVYLVKNYTKAGENSAGLYYEKAGKLPPEGCYTVVAENVLDGVKFAYDFPGEYNWRTSSCPYDESYLRKFMNNDFYNAAFTDAEKDIIQKAEVVNTSFSTEAQQGIDPDTGKIRNKNCCENTEDYIFALSYKEVTDIYEFNLSSTLWKNSSERNSYSSQQEFDTYDTFFGGSDYTACMGVARTGYSWGRAGSYKTPVVPGFKCAESGNDWYASQWWSRSPDLVSPLFFVSTKKGSGATSGYYLNSTQGMLPAMWVKL